MRLMQSLVILCAAVALSGSALAAEGERPSELSLGIGAGWTFPAQVLAPGTVSVRLRLVGGLTLEPSLTLAGSAGTNTNETVFPGTPTSTNESGRNALTLTVGTDIRAPVLARGPLDLVLVGSVFVSRSSSSTDPDGADNNTAMNNLAIGAAYGLAIEWFLGKNLVLSADARNPLVTWNRSRTFQELGVAGAEAETVDSGISAGLVFAPSVRLMVHLYF